MSLCILVAVVALLASCNYGRPAPATPVLLPTATPARVFYTVQRGSVVNQFTFPGKAILADRQELFFEVAGRIDAIHVENGQQVAAGTPIANLYAGGREYEVADARMAVELARERVSAAQEEWAYDMQAAEMELAIAERGLQTLHSMATPDPLELYVQSRRVEQAQLEIDRLQRGVDPEPAIELERAELALQRALEALAETRLTASASGEVRFLAAIEPGSAVSAFEPVASLVDPHSIQVEASLVAEDLTSLYEGMPVIVAPQHGSARTLAGTIVAIPQPAGNGTGMMTLIGIDDGAGIEAPRPGAAVDVTAVIDRADDVLWIPVEAVRGERNQHYVTVRDGGEYCEVEVQVGVRGGGRVEIIQGLDEGEEIVGG